MALFRRGLRNFVDTHDALPVTAAPHTATHGLGLATANLPVKFEVAISIHFKGMKGDTKCTQKAQLSQRDTRRNMSVEILSSATYIALRNITHYCDMANDLEGHSRNCRYLIGHISLHGLLWVVTTTASYTVFGARCIFTVYVTACDLDTSFVS